MPETDLRPNASKCRFIFRDVINAIWVRERSHRRKRQPSEAVHSLGGYTSLFGSRRRRLQRPLTTITLGSDSNRSVG